MKILHVITSIRAIAGTSVFVCELAKEQAQLGYDVTISIDPTEWQGERYEVGAAVKVVDYRKLVATSLQYDIVHIHGLWQYMLHRVAQWARKCGIPVVWSPHGALAPWAMRNHWCKKAPVWYWWQKKDLGRSTAYHVTAQCEVENVRRLGLNGEMIVAPLGVNLPDQVGERNACGMKTLLFVGRLHRVKGLDNLLRAFAAVPHEGWRVRLVGPDQEGFEAELKALAHEFGISASVEFAGAKTGKELSQEYVGATCFVLPSHSENFASVVVEAMAHGLPVIATKGTPWQELEERTCGMWVEIGADPLAAALKKMMGFSDAQRMEMGARGYELVKEKYTWKAVCRCVMKGYEEVVR